MTADGRRGWFDVGLIWACDRIARSIRHFLEVFDDLNRINVEFVSPSANEFQLSFGMIILACCKTRLDSEIGRTKDETTAIPARSTHGSRTIAKALADADYFTKVRIATGIYHWGAPFDDSLNRARLPLPIRQRLP